MKALNNLQKDEKEKGGTEEKKGDEKKEKEPDKEKGKSETSSNGEKKSDAKAATEGESGLGAPPAGEEPLVIQLERGPHLAKKRKALIAAADVLREVLDPSTLEALKEHLTVLAGPASAAKPKPAEDDAKKTA